MKRWAVCRMIVTEFGDHEPAIAKFTGVNWRIVHFGTPTWVVCQFASNDVTTINADPDIFVLPDLTLDTTWGSLPSAARTTAITRLTNAGFDTSGVKLTTTLRQILNALGRQIDTTFNCEAGDVKDVP